MSHCRWIVLFLLLTTGRALAQEKPPLVYAAASLSSALEELMSGPAAEQGLEARLSFASSSSLARQIARGTPADLFVSANVGWMDYLEERGLILPETRVDLLGNRLVIVAPKGSEFPVEIRPDFPFAGSFEGRLALGDPGHVPAGLYARHGFVPLSGKIPGPAPAAPIRQGTVLVYVDVGVRLAVKITAEALGELGLQKGKPVFCLIDTHSIRIGPEVE